MTKNQAKNQGPSYKRPKNNKPDNKKPDNNKLAPTQVPDQVPASTQVPAQVPDPAPAQVPDQVPDQEKNQIDIIVSLDSYIKKNNLLKKLGLSNDYTIRFLAQGEYNKNFILADSQKKYVLRLNYGSQIQKEDQIEYEYTTLKFLEVSGVTPRAYYVDGSCRDLRQGILLMEFLEGRPLNYLKDLQFASKIFAAIHSISIEEELEKKYFIIEKDLLSARIKEADILLRGVWDSKFLPLEIKQILEAVLDYAKRNESKQKYFNDNPFWCINNTEVNSNNFIIGDDESCVYLVDWEKAVVTDPCQDLTHFLSKTSTLWKTHIVLDRDQKNYFIENYVKYLTALTGLENLKIQIEDRIQLYQPYLYLRAISWCCLAFIEYQSDNRELTNQDTFKKIKDYLQIDFLKQLFKEIL